MSLHWPIIRRLTTLPLLKMITDDQRSYKGIELLVASLHVADAIDLIKVDLEDDGQLSRGGDNQGAGDLLSNAFDNFIDSPFNDTGSPHS